MVGQNGPSLDIINIVPSEQLQVVGVGGINYGIDIVIVTEHDC